MEEKIAEIFQKYKYGRCSLRANNLINYKGSHVTRENSVPYILDMSVPNFIFCLHSMRRAAHFIK